MQKKEITNIQTTWDLSKFFSSDDDPKIAKELKKIKKESYKFINKWKNRKDYLENPIILEQALREYEYWVENIGETGNQGYYFNLRSCQDETNPKIKAKLNKLHEFALKIENDIQFFSINIAKIPQEMQKDFLEYRGLKKYKHMLEKTFESAKYILSDAEEKIMNMKAKTSYSNWVNMTSEFISKSEREVLTEDGKKSIKPFDEILSLISSKNKKVRKKAADTLEEIFDKYLDTAEVEINSVLENKRDNDTIRGYTRPDQARHLSDDIDTEIVDTLVAAVTQRFDIPKKYYKFKASLLGQKKLEYYERAVEFGEVLQKYPYNKAVEIVKKTSSALDTDFSAIFENYLTNGQIDVFPKAGKSGGAFCAHRTRLQPTYILLNHTDRLNDVLTLAHELGHGINNEFAKKAQTELNFGTPTSTAEVASTFFEDFVLQNLFEQANNSDKLAIMMTKLDSDVSSIFRQIAFYNFEKEMHKEFREKGYLSKEDLGGMFYRHMKSYMGDAAKGANNWWVYVGHFRSFFYVYSYAGGLLISKYLQKKVSENIKFVEKVKAFLSAGLSDSPKNIFNNLGVDISKKQFWLSGLSEIEDYFNKTVEFSNKIK